MRYHFYQDVFSKWDIDVVVPNDAEQDYIYAKLREELIAGIIRDETHTGFLGITRRLIDTEAIDGLVLGCTELPMLLKAEDIKLHYIDTTAIHIAAIVERCREEVLDV